jgi:hypothetical protein
MTQSPLRNMGDVTQCEFTVHRAALAPSASPHNPLTNPMASGDTSFLRRFIKRHVTDADRLRSRDDRSPPSHPAKTEGASAPRHQYRAKAARPRRRPAQQMSDASRQQRPVSGQDRALATALAIAPRQRARDGARVTSTGRRQRARDGAQRNRCPTRAGNKGQCRAKTARSRQRSR